MIERVAKAIWCAEYPADEWEEGKHASYFHAAYNAIEAMREPTEDMEHAGWCDPGWWEELSPMVVWKAMIDVALER